MANKAAILALPSAAEPRFGITSDTDQLLVIAPGDAGVDAHVAESAASTAGRVLDARDVVVMRSSHTGAQPSSIIAGLDAALALPATPWTWFATSGVISATNIEGGIDPYAYEYGTFEAIHIGDSVTGIGDGAFRDCSSLASITIPDSVTTIGDGAFQYCTSLATITIPDSVTSIGNSVFQSCTSLTSVTIPDSVTSMGSYAFASCTSLTTITIPDSVTSIGSYAFQNCTSLISVTIPDSGMGISFGAFQYCTSLTTITIPDGVPNISSYAFASCSSLASITIPDSVTTIGSFAFYNCSALTTINSPIPKSVWDEYGTALTGTASPLTIHALASDASWTAGTGLTVAGNTNVTVIKDL